MLSRLIWNMLGAFILILSFIDPITSQRVDPVQLLLRSPTAIRQCYSFNGEGNNVQNPTWGAVDEEIVRPEGNNFIDGDWAAMREGPNPRAISNIMSHETCAESDRLAEPCINDWFWLWGQMIDHDMTHIPTFSRDSPADVSIDVLAPSNDPFLGGRALPHRRSAIGPNNEPINRATAYLDSSQIYGTSEQSARSVRLMQGGLLQMTPDGFMPVLPARLNLDHSGVPTFDELGHPAHKDQFLCADMRCNQHAPMAALQTMWIREHNRIATALANARHPAYNTDEAIYQAARAMVIAMAQAVTYNEFLPILLGRFTPGPYTGYKPQVRASISNVFSTAAFRLPHSMIGCTFKETTSTGQVLRAVNFATAFFDSTWIRGAPAQPNRANREQNAYQTIMHSLAHSPSTRMDHKVVPAMRSVLFSGVTTPSGRRPDIAFDVITSDIQRGRDHGLLDYRKMRRAMGWRDITRDTDITQDVARINILRSIYTDLDEIDLFAGMMLEDPLEGSLLGPVGTSANREQFERLRDGDRCWYENQFSGQLLQALRATKLTDLVNRNFQFAGARLFTSDEPLVPRASSTNNNSEGGSNGNTVSTLSSSRRANTLSNSNIDASAATSTPPSVENPYPNRDEALRRRRERRSRLDNGAGVRDATAIDDVVGYRCDGADCTPIALEDEPLDEDILQWARQMKEERRRQRVAEAMGFGTSPANAVVTAQTQNTPGRNGITTTFASGFVNQQNRNIFNHIPPQSQNIRTLQAAVGPVGGVRVNMNGFETEIQPANGAGFVGTTFVPHMTEEDEILRREAALSITQRGAQGVLDGRRGSGVFSSSRNMQTMQAGGAGNNNNNNNTPLQPAPGIRQILPANRPPLPPLPIQVQSENIFLTPQCRR